MSEQRIIIVIDGGTTGAGITQVLVQLGGDLTIIEADAGAGESARARVSAGLAKAHNDRSDAAVQIEADLARVSVAEQYVPGFATTRRLGVTIGLEAINGQLGAKSGQGFYSRKDGKTRMNSTTRSLSPGRRYPVGRGVAPVRAAGRVPSGCCA